MDDPQVYVAKQIFKDFSIQSVIFGKEERLSTEKAAFLRVSSGGLVFFCRFGALQRDIHGEARSLAQFAVHSDGASHQSSQVADNGKPQPAPRAFPPGGGILLEGEEHPFLEGIAHADPVV